MICKVSNSFSDVDYTHSILLGILCLNNFHYHANNPCNSTRKYGDTNPYFLYSQCCETFSFLEYLTIFWCQVCCLTCYEIQMLVYNVDMLSTMTSVSVLHNTPKCSGAFNNFSLTFHQSGDTLCDLPSTSITRTLTMMNTKIVFHHRHFSLCQIIKSCLVLELGGCLV